ncbi:MAG: hypothetical protein JRI55_33325, partial [Deltaproteobacteria bacterium]|nr:hypothetical protein [Deltaproteobacteria bacterium]
MTTEKSKLIPAASPAATETARQALDAIRDADEPGPVVRRLVAQDLLIAWRLADDEQQAGLLALAAPEQASRLFDLACWTADRPDLASLQATLAPLVASGLEGA